MELIKLTNLIFLIFGLVQYPVSIYHFKSFFNPLGVFGVIWGTIPWLYDLHLSSILAPLSIETSLGLYAAYFSFYVGGLSLSRKKYVRKPIIVSNCIYKQALWWYLIMFSIALLEMIVKTPPLFSPNPFAAYLGGVGVRFMHFSIVLIGIPYLIILLSSCSKIKKIILFFPPLFLPIIYLQRGLCLSFLISCLSVYILRRPLRKQASLFLVGLFIAFQIAVIAGNFRTSFNSSASSISDTSGMDNTVPDAIVWLYTYTTPAVQNLNQTINNDNVEWRYGIDFIEPFLSLMQIKGFKSNQEANYEIINGFNVPTYLNLIYLNFGFIGFFIVPLALGVLYQYFYNGTISGQLTQCLIYSVWIPNLIFSFHDFLFFNVPLLLSLILIIIICKKFHFRSFRSTQLILS